MGISSYYLLKGMQLNLRYCPRSPKFVISTESRFPILFAILSCSLCKFCLDSRKSLPTQRPQSLSYTTAKQQQVFSWKIQAVLLKKKKIFFVFFRKKLQCASSNLYWHGGLWMRFSTIFILFIFLSFCGRDKVCIWGWFDDMMRNNDSVSLPCENWLTSFHPRAGDGSRAGTKPCGWGHQVLPAQHSANCSSPKSDLMKIRLCFWTWKWTAWSLKCAQRAISTRRSAKSQQSGRKTS